ncbi:MAG: hypothetical protein AB1589_46275, partial [Cyanobacteriota bacterium]
MAKKRKSSEQEEKQLSLFDHQDESDLTPPAPLPYKGMGEPDSPLLQGEGLGERLTEEYDDDDWLQDEDSEVDFEPSDRTIEPQARELLTLKLLREAIQTQNPGDRVMSDFAEYVLPNLLR